MENEWTLIIVAAAIVSIVASLRVFVLCALIDCPHCGMPYGMPPRKK